MLPPGHVAAGFLTAKALLNIAQPELPQHQLTELIWWGMFFSFAPDLDNFVAYAKIKSWWYKRGMDGSMHRQFYSHVPLIWLIPSLIIYFVAESEYVKYVGLMMLVGSFSHFILDSIEFGVPWLWPFNKEVWALKDRGVRRSIEANGFFEYWWKMVWAYTKRWTFYAEIIILIITLITNA
jgi:membrane-bound metal-dependent hydrolase YbcI (DUF457 family)